MAHWLLKSEPSVFSIDHLYKKPGKKDMWEGVRNFQARNFLRDDLKVGDQCFFYHSNCDLIGIYGMMEVVSPSYPDPTAFDPKSKYFDPKSNIQKPTWYLVDVQFVEKFKQPLSMAFLKTVPGLENMTLLQKGSRLSVQKVSDKEWKIIVALAKKQTLK